MNWKEQAGSQDGIAGRCSNMTKMTTCCTFYTLKIVLFLA